MNVSRHSSFMRKKRRRTSSYMSSHNSRTHLNVMSQASWGNTLSSPVRRSAMLRCITKKCILVSLCLLPRHLLRYIANRTRELPISVTVSISVSTAISQTARLSSRLSSSAIGVMANAAAPSLSMLVIRVYASVTCARK